MCVCRYVAPYIHTTYSKIKKDGDINLNSKSINAIDKSLKKKYTMLNFIKEGILLSISKYIYGGATFMCALSRKMSIDLLKCKKKYIRNWLVVFISFINIKRNISKFFCNYKFNSMFFKLFLIIFENIYIKIFRISKRTKWSFQGWTNCATTIFELLLIWFTDVQK